jgi:hypothetical protein
MINRRETWTLQSVYKLWDTIVQDTRTHVKYHTIMSDVCGKYMYEKFNEIAEDTRRMFTKVKGKKRNQSNVHLFSLV